MVLGLLKFRSITMVFRLSRRWSYRPEVVLVLCCLSFFAGVIVTLATMRIDTARSSNVGSAGSRTKLPTKHPTPVKLAILVLSAAGNTERRAVLRTTWLSNSPTESYRHWFVIGTSDMEIATVNLLDEEQRQYGDLLLLPTVSDKYQFLTEKLLASFAWLSAHQFTHVLKCDDDSYVRVLLLMQLLSDWPRERLYAGFFDGHARPFSKGRWQDTDWDLCDRYLPYALGGGYILSRDLLHHLAENRDVLRRFACEDVSVGAWLAPLKIHRRHEPRFDTEFRSRGCNNQYIITHKQTPNEMLIKHRNLESLGRLCEKELRTRFSYIYDWSQPPSKCCKRTNDSSIP